MTAPVLYIDFETRSPVDLKAAGLMCYARDPLTEALMMGWAFDDEPVALWQMGQPLPARVCRHVQKGGLVVAHNAQFELAIWNFVRAKHLGWPRLTIEQTRCTLAACYAMALPGALENAAHALGLKITKDAEGRTLMLRLCKPRTVVDGQPLYHGTPEQFERLGHYCKQDVAVEREIYKRVLPLSDKEQRLWALDQVINLRGVPFDLASLQASLDVADMEKERLNAEMARVTDGAVAACSAMAALKDWAADFGVMQDSLAKAEVSELLDYEDLPEPVRAALKIRQSAGRFTSISKLKAIKQREVGGRVAYGFQYHGATTGRWAGRGVQIHNFPRGLPAPRDVEDIFECLRTGRVRWLDLAYGEPSIMISKCLRGFVHAAPGKALMGGDFSAVESRGLAWLSGQEDKLAAYRECDANPELPDMYERTYAKTFNRDPYTVTKEERLIGKVEDLSFGFQGGLGAFSMMGKNYGVRVVKSLDDVKKPGGLIVTEDQVQSFKSGWRDGHPKIKQYWYDLQDAAIQAVRDPGAVTRAGAHGREVMFRKRGSFLWCRLPSGRTLCYPYPVLYDGKYGTYLTIKSVPDAKVWARFSAAKESGEPNTTYIVDEPGNSREWCRISTYGGKLAENIDQAICRDLLADAMLRVESAGYPVVMHVHDSVISEGTFTEGDRQKFEGLMNEVPVWAAGFPMAVSCWISSRYVDD